MKRKLMSNLIQQHDTQQACRQPFLITSHRICELTRNKHCTPSICARTRIDTARSNTPHLPWVHELVDLHERVSLHQRHEHGMAIAVDWLQVGVQAI